MMPVMRGGLLVGIITSDNIGEFLSIQSAVDGRTGSAASR
jgi:hypothetical protein